MQIEPVKNEVAELRKLFDEVCFDGALFRESDVQD